VIDKDVVTNENIIRTQIQRNLRKEVHPYTKPSIDMIKKILDDAIAKGVTFDVSDLKNDILVFASRSTNQKENAIRTVAKMVFKNGIPEPSKEGPDNLDSKRLVHFDCEVYPNLLVVVWKYDGDDHKTEMINPSPKEVSQLFNMKLAAYNCRRYDNHILYARSLGYTEYELFQLSSKIINGDKRNPAYFGAAYNISYIDIYDMASNNNRKSLKRWEVDLGINHQEMDIPWDQPVDLDDEKVIRKILDYCGNDVDAQEIVFHTKGMQADYKARLMLAKMSGLPVNATTNQHTAKIIFGEDKDPQGTFIYTDLSKEFPGYEYSYGTSTYRGETVGEGGLVRAKPGAYRNVALLDIASMHPTTIEILNLFGPYTKNFSELKEARLAIKHRDLEALRSIRGGIFADILERGDQEEIDAISFALKIAINSVYGLTAASYPNAFKDPRNIDNIVAKRGALFMMDLYAACEERGINIIHIKTDSVKIADATPESIAFVEEFGRSYGYTFEKEAIYDRLCLVNDAVYIAYDGDHWSAIGTQFAVPYTFKTLFSHEDITLEDLSVINQVQSTMYLVDDQGNDRFVGRVERFCPVKEGSGGFQLVRRVDGKDYAVSGSKGYSWTLYSELQSLAKEDSVDVTYFDNLANKAIEEIEKFTDFKEFVNV
jgi:hypothetical protein